MDNVKYITKLISGEDLYYLKDTEARTNLIDKTEKGVAGGVATLDNSGKVPSSQLPESYASVSKLTVGETEYNPIDGNITIPAYPTTLPASDVSAWAKSDTKPSYTKSEIGLDDVTNDAQVKRSEMGVAEGVATLDTAGKIPSSQLPSYVDDVLEYADKSSFPATGETGKIYIDTSTNLSWRWSGTTYVEISPSLALGETSSTAYAGDKGKALADKLSGIENGAQVHRAPTTAEVKSALGTGSGTSKYLREDGSWQTPPDTNTWRTVQCNGASIGNNTLNLKSGTNVSLSNSNGTITITSTDTNTWRPLGTGANDACAGNDSRLSNSRPASDVYSWAKASSKPSYSWSEITNKPLSVSTGTMTKKTVTVSGETWYYFVLPMSNSNAQKVLSFQYWYRDGYNGTNYNVGSNSARTSYQNYATSHNYQGATITNSWLVTCCNINPGEVYYRIITQ